MTVGPRQWSTEKATAAEIKAVPVGVCPLCRKAKKKSCVYEDQPSPIVTVDSVFRLPATPYYDEEGVYRVPPPVPPPPPEPHHWHCSNGHRWDTPHFAEVGPQ